MAHAAENVRRAAGNVALTIQVARQLESELAQGSAAHRGYVRYGRRTRGIETGGGPAMTSRIR